MDSAIWGTYQKMLQVIKLFVDTKTFGLKIQPKLEKDGERNLRIFNDSN
jgi:hypothetical protein